MTDTTEKDCCDVVQCWDVASSRQAVSENGTVCREMVPYVARDGFPTMCRTWDK